MMDSRRTRKPDRKGALSALRARASRLLSNRVFLLVFSLLAAVAVWVFMMASDGSLTRRKVFENVPVSVSGESALLSRGFIVTDDFGAVLPTAVMTVEVTQSNYDRASASSYNPHVELTQITKEGTYELPIVFSSQVYGQVVSCEPPSVTLHAERYVTRRIPVTVTAEGRLADGLYLVSAEADPATLVVSGPQSEVTRVMRAAVRLDRASLSGERLNDRMSLGFTLEDAAGEAVPQGKITITNQSVVTSAVMVDAVLTPAKEVPLDADALVTGTPAEGYALVEVWPAEDTLTVAADEETLAAVTVIPVETPLDLGGADDTVTGYVRLRAPAGIQNRIPAQMAVTAVIEEQETERTFRNVTIRVEGADEALGATLSQSRTNAQLRGGYAFIRGLSAEDVCLYVDANGLGAGKHVLPVQVRIDNAQPFTCALGSPQVTLTLRER